MGISLFATASRPALKSTQLPNQLLPGTLSPEVKRLGREADHSPSYSGEVKNEWIGTSTPPTRFYGVVFS
jgi:hypothetical protein